MCSERYFNLETDDNRVYVGWFYHVDSIQASVNNLFLDKILRTKQVVFFPCTCVNQMIRFHARFLSETLISMSACT